MKAGLKIVGISFLCLTLNISTYTNTKKQTFTEIVSS